MALWHFATTYEIEIEFVEMDIAGGDTSKSLFRMKNPSRSLPMIEDGDFCIWETNACLRYLAEKYHKSEAYPEAAERAELQKRSEINLMLDWRNSVVMHKLGYCLLYSGILRKAGSLFEEDEAMALWKADGWPNMQRIINKYGGPFLFGDKLTIADCSIFGLIHILHSVKPQLKIFQEGYCDGMLSYLEAVKAHPSYALTFSTDRMSFWMSKAHHP